MDLKDRLAGWFAGLEDGFSGVVYVAREEEVLLAGARGEAQRAEGIPNRIDTRFPIASGCKIFTALAVAKLVEDGRVGFVTPLRDCTDEDLGGLDPGITLDHLLTHRSGITSYFEEDVDPDYGAIWRDRPMYAMRRPRDYLPLFRDRPARFPPGERFEYNDGGFVLLGVAVESITGRPFAEVVTDSVFAPAGMERSGYFAADRLPEGTALAYLPDGRTNVFSVPVVGSADGGAFTTAPDLVRFWDAFTMGRLVGEPILGRMLEPHTDTGMDPPNTHYGYGVWLDGSSGAPRARFVEGFDPGVCMISAHLPESGTTITLLRNTQGPVIAGYRELSGILEEA